MKNDDVLICRCEEITEGEIREAIRNGANTITAVKRVTRAGMGMCQGRTCQKLIARILVEETGVGIDELKPNSTRPPVRVVTFKEMCGDDNDSTN